PEVPPASCRQRKEAGWKPAVRSVAAASSRRCFVAVEVTRPRDLHCGDAPLKRGISSTQAGSESRPHRPNPITRCFPIARRRVACLSARMLTRFSVAPLHTMTRALAPVAMGRTAPDLVITGARILSTYTERIHEAREIW